MCQFCLFIRFQEKHYLDKRTPCAFFLLPQRWGPVIQTMWALRLSKCLHRWPTHSQLPAQGQHSTTVICIDVHQQHPPTHTFITTHRETTCVSLTPESTQPTQAILPTLMIKEPLARPETDGKADKILAGMQYHTGAEQGKAGEKRESCWKILNPPTFFFFTKTATCFYS